MTKDCRIKPSHSQTNRKYYYSDPGGTLKKIKQPKSLFSCNEEVYFSKEVKENALVSHQRANHVDQK